MFEIKLEGRLDSQQPILASKRGKSNLSHKSTSFCTDDDDLDAGLHRTDLAKGHHVNVDADADDSRQLFAVPIAVCAMSERFSDAERR